MMKYYIQWRDPRPVGEERWVDDSMCAQDWASVENAKAEVDRVIRRCRLAGGQSMGTSATEYRIVVRYEQENVVWAGASASGGE